MAGTLRLIVMRHGEAETMTAGGDRKRKLTADGRRQVQDIGRRLFGLGWIPEQAFVSSAERTRETFALATKALLEPPAARYLDNFYLASADVVLTEVAGATVPTIIVVGHNPGWSELVEQLTGDQVSLMPADTALLTIKSESWGEAVQMTGAWECVQILSS